MVCSRCENIIQHGDSLIATEDLVGRMSLVLSKDPPTPSPNSSLETHFHHRSARELEAAAKTGCYLCNALWNTIGDDDRRRLIETDPPQDQENDGDGYRVVTITSVVEASVFTDLFGHELLGDCLWVDKRSLVWMLQVVQPGFHVSPPNRFMVMLFAAAVNSKVLSNFYFFCFQELCYSHHLQQQARNECVFGGKGELTDIMIRSRDTTTHSYQG